MVSTSGILLFAWGKAGYGCMAFNLAVSIRTYSPHIAITLVADRSALEQLSEYQRQIFTEIREISGVSDPGLFKAGMYEHLPYDYTLYLDVDTLCIAPVEPLLERLIADPRYYRCHVYDWYNAHSPDEMPMMYWANRSVIWDHFGLQPQARFPATQSSIQFFKKGPECEAFCASVRELMAENPLPLDRLRYKWGGTQPDELYLNVAIAKAGISPDLPDTMWFCDNVSRPLRDIQADHTFLSYFGTRHQIKSLFCDYHDRSLIRQWTDQGYGNRIYKIHTLFNIKHAANKPVKARREVPPAPIVAKSNKLLNLFTTFFDCGNSERTREYLTCIQKNCENPAINHLWVFAEHVLDYTHPKLTVVKVTSRPTMKQVADFASRQGGVSIMCNTDIYTDSSIVRVTGMDLSRSMLALSRWDLRPGGSIRHFAYEYSQDTWIWEGALPPAGDYFFGLPGCDNKFAYEVGQKRKVYNPSRELKTFHLHKVDVRAYSEKDRLPAPYLHVTICNLAGVKEKRMLFIQPGKVGDIIITAPIVKYFHDQGYNVEWSAPEQYRDMIDQLPYCRWTSHATEKYDRIVDLSFGIDQRSQVHQKWLRVCDSIDSFVTYKYQLAGVPLDLSHNLQYERNEQKESALLEMLHPGKPYKLVHRSSDYGGSIVVDGDSIVLFEPVPGFTIFDWRAVIEQAAEIHCIDSSLLNFVDRVETEAELFYYPIPVRMQRGNQTLIRKKWKIMEEVVV